MSSVGHVSIQRQRDLAVQKGQICLDQAITKTLIHFFVDEACGFSTSSHSRSAQQFRAAYTMAAVTTGVNLNMIH